MDKLSIDLERRPLYHEDTAAFSLCRYNKQEI